LVELGYLSEAAYNAGRLGHDAEDEARCQRLVNAGLVSAAQLRAARVEQTIRRLAFAFAYPGECSVAPRASHVVVLDAEAVDLDPLRAMWTALRAAPSRPYVRLAIRRLGESPVRVASLELFDRIGFEGEAREAALRLTRPMRATEFVACGDVG